MTQTAAQGRGRLSAERTQEVYDSVLGLLVDAGYEGLTMDSVAHAASISKATLYRQWGGKETLVIDALEAQRPETELSLIDTGSLRGDLHAWARTVACAPSKNISIILAVIHACLVSPELRETLRHRMLEREDEATLPYQRAIARGEIAADAPALDYMKLVIGGVVLLRYVLENEQPDEEYLVGLIDSVVLPALGIH